MSADDLADDFVIERIPNSDQEEEIVSAEAPKKKKSKSKKHALKPEDLDIVVEPIPKLNKKTFEELLDKLYADKPKPLIVKSHSKVKIIICCKSALRCLEVLKDLRNIKGLKAAKLFAKHMKVSEQVKALQTQPFLVGVGTPARIMKILESDADAIPLKSLEYLIIDGSFKDKKELTIYDLPETHLDLKKLCEHVKDDVLAILDF